MSLALAVEQELARLTCPASSPQRLEAATAQHRFVCELVQLESMGCAFDSFEVRSDRLMTASIEQLKKVAEQLSQRLTYLLEAIRPIEVDSDQCVVQLRSVPPQKDDAGVRYYELQVARGGILKLCRYHAPLGQPRVSIPAQVTREVLLRLVRDFAEAT